MSEKNRVKIRKVGSRWLGNTVRGQGKLVMTEDRGHTLGERAGRVTGLVLCLLGPLMQSTLHVGEPVGKDGGKSKHEAQQWDRNTQKDVGER